VNEGRKDIELFIETEEVLDDMNEFEFDEFGTAFDTICFEFLDEFMKNTLGKTHANNELEEILSQEAFASPSHNAFRYCHMIPYQI
jgi:hypothetical protein